MQKLVGRKIKLIKMVYENPIVPGTVGTVKRIDSLGLIHVKWDSRRGITIPIVGLAVDPELDTFEIIK